MCTVIIVVILRVHFSEGADYEVNCAWTGVDLNVVFGQPTAVMHNHTFLVHVACLRSCTISPVFLAGLLASQQGGARGVWVDSG